MTTKQRTNKLYLQLGGGGSNNETDFAWPDAHAGFAELELTALPPLSVAAETPQKLKGFEGEVWKFTGDKHVWMVDLRAMPEIALAQFLQHVQETAEPGEDITIQPQEGLLLDEDELLLLWPYIRQEIKVLRQWPVLVPEDPKNMHKRHK